MHGRALLQLISHRNNPINYEDENNAENKSTFCYSHVDCLAEKFLEVRLGDCAILEQKNERVNGRSFPETCVDRRLESLTVIDCSYNTMGLTFCGGDSGLHGGPQRGQERLTIVARDRNAEENDEGVINLQGVNQNRHENEVRFGGLTQEGLQGGMERLTIRARDRDAEDTEGGVITLQGINRNRHQDNHNGNH
uniref:Uncharacterized protein n=1 Tax=Meloidogyne javanica TaxID=6303 RepID=A0A915N978_MELJA